MQYIQYSMLRPKKRKFVSCNRPNMVGRSVKEISLHYFIGQKCVFYACFS